MPRDVAPLCLLVLALALASCLPDDDDSADVADDDAGDDDSAPTDDDSGDDDVGDDDAGDDDAGDDDAGDDDAGDDDVVDPCSAIDISANVGGDHVFGSNAGEGDGYKGSCQYNDVPEVLYSFVAPEAGSYIVSTDNPGTDFDTLIYAFLDCTDPLGTELACNDDNGYGLSSTIVLDLATGQMVYVAADGYATTGSWELSITSVECGNGSVEGSEDCDDGNEDDGDGCSAGCTWECADDAWEENEDAASATDLSSMGFPLDLAGLVLCPYDVASPDVGLALDVYALALAEDEYVEVMLGPGASLTPSCWAQQLQVGLGSGPTSWVASDNTLDGQCATLLARPGAGTWYLTVSWTAGAVAPQDYALAVSVGTEECGDGVQGPLEECDDGNVVSGDGCSENCASEDVTCPVATDITFSVGGSPILGSTATTPDDHDPSCAAGGSPEIVFEFEPLADVVVTASTAGGSTGFDTVLYVRTDCLDEGSEVACSNNGWGGDTLTWTALAGTTYYLAVDGVGGASGVFELRLTQ